MFFCHLCIALICRPIHDHNVQSLFMVDSEIYDWRIKGCVYGEYHTGLLVQVLSIQYKLYAKLTLFLPYASGEPSPSWKPFLWSTSLHVSCVKREMHYYAPRIHYMWNLDQLGYAGLGAKKARKRDKGAHMREGLKEDLLDCESYFLSLSQAVAVLSSSLWCFSSPMIDC